MDTQSFISRTLNNLVFLEEFVFAKNKFSPPCGSELELADAVVMLGDVLLICQIKERSKDDEKDESAERRWFESKVQGKATMQVRDTLLYLQTFDQIFVPNERGRVFNLAACKFSEILKIVVYDASAALPDDCRRIRHHISNSAGLIHIVEARNYLEISRTLRVPEEVVRYFKYREMVLRRFPDICASIPEAAIAGHFIGGDRDLPPRPESMAHLQTLIQDEDEWDLAPILRDLHDRITHSPTNDDYYDILIEFAKLPRSAWREVKKRIRLCIKAVKSGTFEKPYRISCASTDCGFVFVPVTPQVLLGSEWKEIRTDVLLNFAHAHKYDQHLLKSVGIMIERDGEHLDVLWCLVSYPWVENVELQNRLDQNFPFRIVTHRMVEGYRFAED